MGKIITFRSPYHGQCKTTSTAVAVAMTTEDAVITHIQPNMSNLENMLGYSEQGEMGALNDTGMNNLIYNATARLLCEKDIKSAAIEITENLSLLPALGQTCLDAEKDLLICHLITKELPKYYKYVFIDLGTESRELSKKIQNAADINYVVLSQNVGLWKKHDVPNVQYILSGYTAESSYSLNYFKFKVSSHSYAVPFCAEYMDAISQGSVKLFFERNEKVTKNRKKKTGVENFINAVREVPR